MERITKMENKKKGYLIALGCMTLLSAGLIMTANNGNSNFSTSRVAKAAAPTNTRRIWLVNNGGYNTDVNWWTKENLVVHVYHEGQNDAIDVKGATLAATDYYQGLWYVDVELANVTTSIKVIVGQDLDDSGIEIDWGNNNQTGALELPAFGTDADVIWLQDGNWWDSEEKRNSRNANVTTAGLGGSQLAEVLSGYKTCDPSNTNGYNAYPQLEKSILDACSAEAKAYSTSFADYDYDAYVQAGKSYEGMSKTSTSTVASKIAGLEYWYDYNN